MAAKISLVSINLATMGIISFLYGIFFLLFLVSTYLLIMRHHLTAPNKSPLSIFLNPFCFASLCIFATVTGHWVSSFIRLFDAFVIFNDGRTPAFFYGDLSQITDVVKTAFTTISILIGDAVITYRLWIVWSCNKIVIIFPLCSLVGFSVCAVGIIVQSTKYALGQEVFISEASQWIISETVLSLCINLYCSILIAWKIHKNNSSAREYGGQSLNSVLAIVVESAAIYTTWTIFFLTCYESRSNLQLLAIDAAGVFSGIAFMLINVRVGLGWAHDGRPRLTGDPGSGTGIVLSWGVVSGTFGMQSVVVTVSNAVDGDRQSNSGATQSKFLGRGVLDENQK